MQPEVITRSEPEYKNLKMVAAMLEYESSNNSHYEVEDVYFDYGQDWMWTTITRRGGKWGGVQVLNPRQWEDIILANSLGELVEITHEIRHGKYFNE